ncbi:hypothetical protein ACFQLX_04775 [Streptomyces polyrhachis]|uniref:Copper resistance protein D domain-containing protein n=1 Tax=Streptomyces polyrhachis TaxID=1282885 RepID=A0ABW2G9T1_9ACTN
MPSFIGFGGPATLGAALDTPLRWCALAGLVALGGTALCLVLVRPVPPRARTALGRLLAAALGVGAAGLLGLLLLPGPLSGPSVRLRATLLVLLIACWALGRYALTEPLPAPGGGRDWWRGAAALGTTALVLTAAGCWQLAELPPRAPLVPALLLMRSLQLAAITCWLGGLIALAVLLIVTRAEQPAMAAARRFTPAALVALHLLMAVVSMQAWQTVGAAPLVLGTGYGRLLLVQLGALTLLVALDALARACLQRPWDGAPGAVVRVVLHRTLAAQLLIGAALLAVAGPLPLWSPELPVALLQAR